MAQAPTIDPALLSGLMPGQTETLISNPLVQTAASKVVPNSPLRKSLLFVNLSPNLIYINVVPQVGIANGILLVANGGSFSSADWEDFDLTRAAFYAIATAINSPLMVVDVSLAT